jgi:hypothetical protein
VRVARLAAALTLASLPPRSATELTDEVESLVTQIQLRAHPLGIDLEDRSPEQRFKRLLAVHAPTWTSALALAQGRWTSPDRTQTVTLVPRCRPPATCVALADGAPTPPLPAGVDARGIRFWAWPVTSARRLRTTASGARRLAEHLRGRLGQPGSPLGLVLLRPDLLSTPAPDARLANASARLHRWLLRANVDRRLRLPWVGLSSTDRPPPAAPSLELREDEVLVIPRLGALAHPERTDGEITAALAQLGLTSRCPRD